MIRFHGVFAPNAALRAAIVPAMDDDSDDNNNDADAPICTHAGRQSYAFLMKRIFAIDVEQCPKCGERDTKIQFVTARDEIDRILKSMGHARAGPESDTEIAA